MPKLGTYNSPVDEKTIAKRLREARKRRGITQVELAEKLGIRQVLISQYELGQTRIHGAMIAGIANALGTSADDILGLKAPKKDGSAIDDRRFFAASPRSTGSHDARKTRFSPRSTPSWPKRRSGQVAACSPDERKRSSKTDPRRSSRLPPWLARTGIRGWRCRNPLRERLRALTLPAPGPGRLTPPRPRGFSLN